MTDTLTRLIGQICFVYSDNITVFSKTAEEHSQDLKLVFVRPRSVNFKLKPEKCNFMLTTIKYLGHIIYEDGICPDEDKTVVIEYLAPKTFIGLVEYYCGFILNFAKVAQPLTELTKKDIVFEWNLERGHAFSELHEALCDKPILSSGTAMGAVLSQIVNGTERPNLLHFTSVEPS
ncbi:hypothetical protein PR048_024199 [Dryococelus australis]|uniref:Reverse transcriptase domain-containing protein n=1 Tax=Dryococelus australis TaxID=614101 RepID=A0ABQ9GW82_9NEOP|nr:hypothetical protein PR048_024199 [Dryococelus australis]